MKLQCFGRVDNGLGLRALRWPCPADIGLIVYSASSLRLRGSVSLGFSVRRVVDYEHKSSQGMTHNLK